MVRRRLNRGFMQAAGRKLRYFYLRLILLPDSPHRVSLGLAVGVLVGMTPTVPLQTALAILLAWMVRGSKVAAYIGIWITNPITIPPLYTAMFFVGRALTPFGHQPHTPAVWHMENLLQLGTDLALAMFCGGLILGVIFAPITYLLSYKYTARLQAWERSKIRNKHAVPEEIIS